MDPVTVMAAIRDAGPACWAAVPEISARAVAALCSAVWEGALLAGVVAVGLRMMPRLTAAARSAVWLNVFALVAGLHFVPVMMEHGAAGSGMTGLHFDSGHAALFHLDPRWSVAVAAVWAALTAWRLGELAASAVSLRGVARRATVVDAGETVRALLDGESDAGRRGRGAELCTSDEVERPCVIGFFRPRVLIPEALLGALSEVELGQVLLHEMEHVRRWDDWRNLAQKIGVAVFPLNPALAWVEHRLCTERELACDDRVLRASAERKTYALCLARVAEFSIVNRGLALALGAWGRRPELVKRVQRILRRPAETPTGRMAVVGPAAMTLAALGCALVLAGSPQVVSFAPRVPAMRAGAAWHEDAQATSAENADAARMIEASARMERAELKNAQATKAVMVKAVKPQAGAGANVGAGVEQAPADAEVIHGPRRRTATLQTVTARRRLPAAGADDAWLSLAVWQRAEMLRQAEAMERLIQTMESERTMENGAAMEDGRPAFAAVPFGIGWLVVQL